MSSTNNLSPGITGSVKDPACRAVRDAVNSAIGKPARNSLYLSVYNDISSIPRKAVTDSVCSDANGSVYMPVWNLVYREIEMCVNLKLAEY